VGFLTWAAAGATIPVPGLLVGTIGLSVPLIFGALGGVISERVGVVNVAIEGQLLAGAFVSAVVASITDTGGAAIAVRADVADEGAIDVLFKTAEQEFNSRLKQHLIEYGHGVWLPQDESDEQTGEKAATEIFSKDVEGIDWADVVVANMDGPDPDSGTCWECGYAYRKKPVVIFRTDFRIEGGIAPYNLMLTESATKIVTVQPFSSSDAVAQQINHALLELTNQ